MSSSQSEPRANQDDTAAPATCVERPPIDSVPSGDDVTLRPDGSTAAASASASRDRGRCIGRFVLLDRLGQGGMGVVYLAYDPELDRRVALKLVAAGGAGESATTRLLREAQALAQLSHPNIVAVHDVGRLDDSIYVAMEYVDGTTIGAWLRERERSWQEIVAIFTAAARGIAAAHEAGLVHRDIKPDNIIVGRDGRVRVLDFGLARASVSRAAASADRWDSGTFAAPSLDVELTVPGTMMGTPVYMSPEQYAGEPADARSDVYSLCVALWEAVHGRRPFAGTSLAELAENVVAGRLVDAPDGRAPAWLQAVLRRGLARSPSDRFASMHALVDELERDRRRRARVGAAGAALVVAVGVGAGVATMVRSGPTCDAFVATLAGVWDPTVREAVAGAFVAHGKAWAEDSHREVERTLDAYAGRLVAARTEACEAARVHGTQSDEVMGRRMACIDRRTQYLGGLTRSLAGGGSTILEQAVEAVHALPEIDACADVERLLREAPLPEDPATRAEVEAIRGEIVETAARASAADVDGLDVRIDEIVARAAATEHAPVHAEALLLRGRRESGLGHGDAAAEALEKALALAEHSGHDEAIVEASIELMMVDGRLRSRFDAADVHARHADAVLGRMGDPPELRMHMLSHLGQLESLRKRPEQALAALEEAVAIAHRLGRDLDPSTSLLFNAMTVALIESKRLDEADELIGRSIEMLERRVGARHPDMAIALTSRARLRRVQKRDDEAIELWRRARAIFLEALGPDHSNVGATYNGEGLALVALGRDAEAEQAFEQALRVIETTLGRDHVHVAVALCNLGAAQTRAGRAAEAVESLRRAVEIRSARLGSKNAQTASAQDLLGDALLRAGDLAGAAETYQRAIATFEALGGHDDPRAAYAVAGLGRVAQERGDPTTAREHLERALAIEPTDAPAHERGDRRVALAQLLATRDPARARTLLDEARAAYVAAGPRAATRLAALERTASARGR